ncbi:40S ribosomal protein S11 [Iris pallida]|uniref:40S ribosomal protein S11 n=1 Tax=Iris pallida TaxID=29817 RepID=A0AAX6EMB8_IRIPA|nr:40S ribosomal protein S11 [Iris pallida]
MCTSSLKGGQRNQARVFCTAAFYSSFLSLSFLSSAMAEQTEKAFLKQPKVSSARRSRRRGRGPGKPDSASGKRRARVQDPQGCNEGTYIDKKCPFTGDVSIRGRVLAGTCHSAKMNRTIIVRRNYLHYVKKYQRQVREKALKYCCTLFPLLPCEGRRPCCHWPVQATVQNCEVQCVESYSSWINRWWEEGFRCSLKVNLCPLEFFSGVSVRQSDSIVLV